MDTVRIDVKGDRQAGIRFDEFPDALYADLRKEVDALSNELFALIRATTPVKTGTLISQERLRLFADKNRITGYVDIAGRKGTGDFAKAAALEYGARRQAKVRAHPMKLDHFWANKLDAPVTVLVKAFRRPTNIAEHAFERGSLRVMMPNVIARLNAVVEQAVAKANA